MPFVRPLKFAAVAGALCLLAACGKKDDASATPEPAPAPESAPAPVASPAAASSESAAEPALSLDTPDQKISYAMGFQIAERYSNDPVLALDGELLIRGIRDSIAGKEMAVSHADAQAADQELQARMQAHQTAASAQARSAGEAFLEANKAKPGIVATASGLQYEILKEGDSDQSPKATDTVTVHYHGTLTDGTVFDSSVERGMPATFALDGVIPGWTEGVQHMTVGDKFRFFIPSELAYGPRAMGDIPAHSALIFEVELLAIGGE